MNVKDFDYELPERLIAQTPLADRTASRLLVMDKVTGEIQHRHFSDIAEYLRPGDCLVLNDTRVIPARIIGEKKETGGAIEFVLLKRLDEEKVSELAGDGAVTEEQTEKGLVWEVILKPGRRAKEGAVFTFGGGILEAKIIKVKPDGNRVVLFTCDGPFEEVLYKVGTVPLPPYIKEKLDDPERYQTVYARENGSAAAPTAGLHFTEELLDKLRAKGVKTAFVTLHVGLGTFRPVKTEKVEDHLMHEESFEITAENCEKINSARASGGRIIAVGTTSTRVLESVAGDDGHLEPYSGSTKIFIYPGYRFKAIDGLITNFHLPQSTLIMLVSAFAGRENILNAYRTAVEEEYRFFSFGDACLFI
ncbi:MAG: tRNA preQ1(34) S-adenosylmethionine ribosyltransferase-isomerase QueA [Clostridia bacterium]|nr:tRNA preQ1(34) S-adenosylmethionine ribosyltransferase-isomerase QueA [Clostridia bacterium]